MEGYFEWLHSLENKLTKEIRKRFGNDFFYDLTLAAEASKHSELMRVNQKICRSSLRMPGVGEAVISSSCAYNDHAIISELGGIAGRLHKSNSNHRTIFHAKEIGVGIAINQGCIADDHNCIAIYVTIRTKKRRG